MASSNPWPWIIGGGALLLLLTHKNAGAAPGASGPSGPAYGPDYQPQVPYGPDYRPDALQPQTPVYAPTGAGDPSLPSQVIDWVKDLL